MFLVVVYILVQLSYMILSIAVRAYPNIVHTISVHLNWIICQSVDFHVILTLNKIQTQKYMSYLTPFLCAVFSSLLSFLNAKIFHTQCSLPTL